MKDKKTIKNFIYGTQYYRAPTPLQGEWEYDLKNMAKAGLDTIQIRVQWRWNEPVEGKYCFEDTDRLFELAGNCKKNVIFKFLMECAPDYIFFKCKGGRKDMHGQPLNPGAHGAYYVGGWLPCFDNPDVVNKAKEFVRVFVKRYRGEKSLLLWNIWNEPLSRPIGECGCEYSIQAYRKWLEKKHGSICVLNDRFGKKWENFETVMPPSMPRDYAELYLWRLWAMDAVKARLEFMYESVKELDDARPVISHIGGCSVIQDIASASSDDMNNAEVVDFYGTSLPTAAHFTNILEESYPFMICDWLRSVSEYFWVCELYPDWGNWHKPVSPQDFRFKVWATISCGSKGLLYWQYRAERLGCENNLAGLVNIDGSFKEITLESFKIREVIKKYEKLLMTSKVRTDDIGILYSVESDLVNRIENTGSENFWNFDLAGGYPYLYKKALFGTYALFREAGVTAEWVERRNLEEKLPHLKLLYLPECFILAEDTIKLLRKFIKNGGIVIAEEGAGLRKENTWLQSEWPGGGLIEMFGVKIKERISAGDKNNGRLTLFGRTIAPGGYIAYLKPEGGETKGRWDDGQSGAVRKGNAFFLGTSLGVSFYENFETGKDDYVHILSSILDSCKLPVSFRPAGGLYLRRLSAGSREILFAFNRSSAVKELPFEKGTKIICEMTEVASKDANQTENKLKIPPYEVKVCLCKRHS